jgi:hypothetical protein
MVCGRSCLAVRERHAARIDAGRLSANTRPSHAVEIRFTGRAARRIDRGETVFGTNVSPVSVHAYARRGSIVECRIFSARIRASLALVDTAYGRAVAEETREETPGGSLPPFGRLQTTIDAGRMTRVTSPQTQVLPRVLALAWRSVTVSAHRRAALCAAGDFDSEPQTGRERPRVWNAEVFPGPSRGSLTSWLPVWQPPTLPSARSAWCQSRDRAAPTRHAPRQEAGAWGGSGSAWPVPGQPDASQVAIAMLHASWRRTGLAVDGRPARRGQADGSALDEDRVSVVIPGSFARCSRPSLDRVWSCARRRSMFFATLPPCGGPSDIDGACAQLRICNCVMARFLRPCGLADG